MSPITQHNHDPIPDLDVLASLLSRGPQREYKIDSRESTPQIYPSDPLLSDLEYWKDLAATNSRLIRSINSLRDYRKLIPC